MSRVTFELEESGRWWAWATPMFFRRFFKAHDHNKYSDEQEMLLTSTGLEPGDGRDQLVCVGVVVDDNSGSISKKPLRRSRSRTRNFDMGGKGLSPHVDETRREQ